MILCISRMFNEIHDILQLLFYSSWHLQTLRTWFILHILSLCQFIIMPTCVEKISTGRHISNYCDFYKNNSIASTRSAWLKIHSKGCLFSLTTGFDSTHEPFYRAEEGAASSRQTHQHIIQLQNSITCHRVSREFRRCNDTQKYANCCQEPRTWWEYFTYAYLLNSNYANHV